jgi:hypothetical protein
MPDINRIKEKIIIEKKTTMKIAILFLFLADSQQ